jgi:hypothetical protein
MASLQAYQSHGRRYYRIVESFRQNGRPRIRVVAHLGRVEDILRLHQQERIGLKVSSVSAGAVTALYHLACELDVAGRIDRALKRTGSRHLQKRDGLTVGQTLVAGMISRACAPRSKRAFASWAESTWLPELMGFSAPQLTSQHFWEQMNAVPIERLADIEQELVGEVMGIERLRVEALAYDTTNFYTHIATTNRRPQLPQRGHNKQGRHDLRQLGLALVVDQATQLPLAHALYEGAHLRQFPPAATRTLAKAHPRAAAVDLSLRCRGFVEKEPGWTRWGARSLCNGDAAQPSSSPAGRSGGSSGRGDTGQRSDGAGVAHARVHRR